ncbi:hypothetical protein SAMN05421823_10728 [Catalinimonas alkaloidigena]|uniref:Oligosaccharide repeat unit polymerase n=1 Tax=Catalinimonas alkaloidigena TaxID=1075417 RepID=A0A1G9LG95_9BACT|nr:O-antigen polymerase [Catalinimonas alkaloidigena]SDL60505.1 hypothetical protein SAMN05421823_10728 [Catalinimonas alkaloidigena]
MDVSLQDLWVPILTHLVNFGVSVWVVHEKGGLRANLPYSLVLGLYFVFTFYTPVVNVWAGNLTLYGHAFGAYVESGLLLYSMGVAAFSLGYLLLPAPARRPLKSRWSAAWVQQKLPMLWGIFAGVIFVNLLILGVLSNRWSLTLLFYAGGYSPYLEACTDSLITLFTLALVCRVRLRWLVVAGVLLFGLFMLAGWRYRIVMLLIIVGGWWLMQARVSPRFWTKAVLGTVLAGIVVMWITLNRAVIVHGWYEAITFDLTQFDESEIRYQTNNSQAFFSVLEYLDRPDVSFDYGRTMFGFILVRPLPAFLFPEGQKPDPPALTLLHQAFAPTDERVTAALTNLGEWYVAFGLPGVVLGMMAFGCLLSRFPPPRMARASTSDVAPMPEQRPAAPVLHQTLYLLLTAWLFQYVTRGYLPQHVELAVYLMLPLGALAWWARREAKR